MIKDILWLSNTEGGKHLLGIKDKYPVVKATSNSIHQLVDEDTYKATFWCYEKVKKLLYPFIDYEDKFWNMGLAKGDDLGIDKKYDRFLAYNCLEGKLPTQIPQIYLTSTAFYSGAGDGYVAATQATWAATRNDTTASYTWNGTNTTNSSACHTKNFNNTNFYIGRSHFPFNTAALTSAATITAATFGVYGIVVENEGSVSVGVVQSTEADPTSLVADDYNNFNNTQGSDSQLTFASFGVGSTQTFTLNSTGRGWISKTGWTKLGTRPSQDIADTAPASGEDNSLSLYFSESDNDPVLTVTYTLPVGFFSIL